MCNYFIVDGFQLKFHSCPWQIAVPWALFPYVVKATPLSTYVASQRATTDTVDQIVKHTGLTCNTTHCHHMLHSWSSRLPVCYFCRSPWPLEMRLLYFTRALVTSLAFLVRLLAARSWKWRQVTVVVSNHKEIVPFSEIVHIKSLGVWRHSVKCWCVSPKPRKSLLTPRWVHCLQPLPKAVVLPRWTRATIFMRPSVPDVATLVLHLFPNFLQTWCSLYLVNHLAHAVEDNTIYPWHGW